MERLVLRCRTVIEPALVHTYQSNCVSARRCSGRVMGLLATSPMTSSKLLEVSAGSRKTSLHPSGSKIAISRVFQGQETGPSATSTPADERMRDISSTGVKSTRKEKTTPTPLGRAPSGEPESGTRSMSAYLRQRRWAIAVSPPGAVSVHTAAKPSRFVYHDTEASTSATDSAGNIGLG